MYLAPLNYDRYFKKVFSNVDIAKRFLEDFFGITIQDITPLDVYHKITDEAAAVEFDFHCKIDDQFVIIDMQQWYKSDIVHRFYTYHCINTALQLENLPLKSIALEGDRERKVKDYNEILPVITFVWMVDDTFGFKDDYISYTMTPEIIMEFIKNNLLWQNKDITELLKQREIALTQLSNKAKRLDFLQKNRLIYAFQKNIVSNNKKNDNEYHKYIDWFELAEKTKNKKNQKSDFIKYEKDEIFAELIRRICNDTLTTEDYTYIDNYEQFTQRVKRYDKVIYQEGREEGVQIGVQIGVQKGVEKGREEGVQIGVQIGVQKGIEEGVQIGVQKGREEGVQIGVEIGVQKGIELERQKQQQEKIEMIKEMIDEGMTDNQITKLTKIDIIEIQKIRNEDLTTLLCAIKLCQKK